MKAILDNSTIFFFNFIFLHEQILCETTQGHTISFFPPPFMLQQNKTKKNIFFFSLSLFILKSLKPKMVQPCKCLAYRDMEQPSINLKYQIHYCLTPSQLSTS